MELDDQDPNRPTPTLRLPNWSMRLPELVGRMPVVVPLEALDEEALVKILKEPKNALTKQYHKLFELEDVKITFEESALRAILEETLLEIMFDLPSREDVVEVKVTEACISNGAPPLLEIQPKRQKKEA